MSKFTNSNEAISSSLMLWQTKPTQVSVKESYDTKVWPISNIFNEGPITFSIPEQPHGMVKNIEIVTKFKIQKDGKDFSVEQDNLSIINNFPNSLWQIVDVTINGRSNIMQPLKNAYPYTSFFNMVFNHDDSQVDYLGYKELFFMDNGDKYEIKSGDKLFVSDYSKMYSTVGQKIFAVNGKVKVSIGDIVTSYAKDETENSFAKMPNPSIKNQALYTRAKRVAKGQSVTTYSKLHCPLFNTNKVLPTRMDIRITLTKNTDDFLLRCPKDEKYSISIEDVHLQVTYYQPQDAIQRKIESLLESEPIPYFVQRPELIVRPITATTKVIRVNDIFPSKLPSYAFFCVQKSADFEGKRESNPFSFIPFEKMNIFIGGKPFFQDELEARLKTDSQEPDFTQFLVQLYKTLGREYKGNCLINSKNFYTHFCVAASFTADKSPANASYLNLQEQGSCSIEIDTGKDSGLTNCLLIVYASYDRQIKINPDRSIDIIE